MWTIALVFNILHLAYHQITTNFDLFPFNNIRTYTKKQRIAEALVNGATMSFPIIALCINKKQIVNGACWALGMLFVGELLTWWKPYLFKSSDKWKNTYDTIFKPTITFLPAIKNNPIPNLEHCILHILTLITFLFTISYLLNHF